MHEEAVSRAPGSAAPGSFYVLFSFALILASLAIKRPTITPSANSPQDPFQFPTLTGTSSVISPEWSRGRISSYPTRQPIPECRHSQNPIVRSMSSYPGDLAQTIHGYPYMDEVECGSCLYILSRLRIWLSPPRLHFFLYSSEILLVDYNPYPRTSNQLYLLYEYIHTSCYESS